MWTSPGSPGCWPLGGRHGPPSEKVAAAIGDHEDLTTTKLDVTSPSNAQAAVEAAIQRFGHIDVLVNNAGNFFAGFFEELSPEQVRKQIETAPLRVRNSGSLCSTGPKTASVRGRQEHFETLCRASRGMDGYRVAQSSTTELLSVPMSGTCTSTTSPAFKYFGGSKRAPAPSACRSRSRRRARAA